MEQSYHFTYAPISVSSLVPLSPLPVPVGFHHSHGQFAAGIPFYRLNLLSTDGTRLYFPYCSTNIAVYSITRSKGVFLTPLASPQIIPSSTINNSKVANLKNGKRALILTGGHQWETNPEPASLTVLALPDANRVEDVETVEFGNAHTMLLSLRSAWGLDIHDASARVVFSCNSRYMCELSLNLLLSDDAQLAQLSDATRLLQLRHSNNIPCVAFSPDGKHIASASIDGIFAIHDVSDRYSSEHRCVFEYSPPRIASHTAAFGRHVQRCWSVHWFENSKVAPAAKWDPVWHLLKAQRQTLIAFESFGELNDFYAENAARHEELFWKAGQSDLDKNSEVGGNVLYNDGAGLDAGDQKMSSPKDDELAMHSDYNEEAGSLRALSLAQTCEESNRRHSRVEEDNTFGFRISLQNEGRTVVGVTGQNIGQEQFLLVGRESRLILYRVHDGEGTKNVTEVDSLDIFVRGNPTMACTDAQEITALGVVVVSVKGLGVLLLRLINSTESGDDNAGRSPRLLVERVFSRKRDILAVAFLTAGDDVIGTAIVHRGDPNSSDYCAELWILWQDAMIECWELTRPINVFDTGYALL